MKLKIIILLLLINPCYLLSQEVQDPLAGYLANFQYQKALEYIDMQEPTTELDIKKALCYKALGEYRKAIEVLLPLSKGYPDNIQIKSNLAACYEAMSQRQASVDCYDELIRLDSTNLYFKNQKADILYQLGKYEDALFLFRQVLGQNNSPLAIRRMAQCFEKMNMVDSARMYFMEAWNKNPDDSFSAANLINLSLKIGRVHEAMAYSDKYIETDSTDRQINLLNALSYYTADDYEESVARFTKCFYNGDSSLVVNRSLGISHYSLNESAKAIPYLEAAYRQDTTNNNVVYCLAISYMDMVEYALAVPLFHKLLDRTIPQDLTLYLYYKNLAESYNKQNDVPNANKYYEEALKYAGDTQKMNTYYILANMNEFSLKNRKKALEYYKLYKESLHLYINTLKEKDSDESEEIKRTEKILVDLEKYIKDLQVSSARK